MPIDPVVVDAHSHIFNAEDLPIDGFVKQLAPVPRFMTSIVSKPLDALTSWLAPGSSNETDAILRLLRGDGAGFTVGQRSRWATGSDLGFPEVAAGFTVEETAGTDLVRDVEAAMATLTPSEREELATWYDEWASDDEIVAVDAAGFKLPGFLDPRNVAAAVGRYIGALKIITRYRYLVADEIAATYPDVQLFVPALVDFTAATKDRPATKVRDQVRVHSLVSKLSIAGKLPRASGARIHPLVGFDPLREIQNSLLGRWKASEGFPNRYVPFADVVAVPAEEDRYYSGIPFDPVTARALEPLTGDDWNDTLPNLDGVMRSLDIVRYAIEQGGFAGVKIYPPTGFLPLGNHLRFPGDLGEQLDVAMRVLYTYCVAMDVPILTHAAHSNGFEEGYDDLAGPAGWEMVLKEFPDLRLCLGHFGHLHLVGDDPDEPRVNSWPSRFVRLIDTYPNVSADVGNSKLPASAEYRERFAWLLGRLLGGDDALHAKRRKRLLYGSDWWMNVMAPKHPEFMESFRGLMDEHFDDATCDAFMGMNALRWLGIIDDDDEIVVANQNRRRLRACYPDTHPAPAWLGPA